MEWGKNEKKREKKSENERKHRKILKK
ncbi:Protein CBG27253 [Caenorhabditis briggsae]|uniref:Protein CBG27253 n=1 Tax=Caenorhabditis briggsae TaxID=6238 RepID=B6IFX5_CAEBR|nr:Protein CBG27253 [Caenorhabditis briggsae]CAR98791.1 Protein CBG27253 [Caenorhabditis briggsae]